MKISEQVLRANYGGESGAHQKVLVKKGSDTSLFAPGQLFKGRVAGFTEDNKILLEVDGRLLTAKSVVPLEVGSEVWLETESGGDLPLLSLAAKKGAVQDFLKLFISGIPLSSPKSKSLPDIVSSLYKDLIPKQSIEGQLVASGVAAATSSGHSIPESVELLASLLGESSQLGKQFGNLVNPVRQGGGQDQNVFQAADTESFLKILTRIDAELVRISQKLSLIKNTGAIPVRNETTGSDLAMEVVSRLQEDFVEPAAVHGPSSVTEPVFNDNQLQRLENILSRYTKTMEALPELQGAKGNGLPHALAAMRDRLLEHLVAIQKEIKIMLESEFASDRAVSFGMDESSTVPGLSGLQKELTAFLAGLNQQVSSLKQNNDGLQSKFVPELAGLHKELASLREIAGQRQSHFASLAAASNESILASCSELKKAVQDLLAVIASKESAVPLSPGMLVEGRVFNMLASIQEEATHILQNMPPGDSLPGGEYGRTDAKLVGVVREIEKKIAQFLGDNSGKDIKPGERAEAAGEKLVKLIAAHHAVNSIPSQTSENNFLLFPCFFAGNTGWGEWIFSREKEENTKGKEQYKIAFYLEMSKLGPLCMQATVAGKAICGQFLLASDNIKRHLEENVPEIAGILMQLGYNPVTFKCGVSKFNVFIQLKEALEEKAAVPRFSLLDVSI